MKLPKEVKFILDTFFNNSYEAFIVGGCVRDNLLGRELNDYDITTNALPKKTVELFEKTIPTGIKHGTITVMINKKPFEVTTYRVDGEYKDNRHPTDVVFVSNIKEDLARRDFTINALAYSPYFGFKDFFNGQDDLKNKIIKAVGNADKRFNEDALRMLRAIRFSAQLNFSIEPLTFLAIQNNATLIKSISKERINIELSKTLLNSNSSSGIIKLYESNLLKNIFPKLYDLHFEQNYFLGNISLLDKLNDFVPSKFLYMLMVCFKNINEHEIKNTLKELRLDNKTIANACCIYEFKNSITSIKSTIELKKELSKLNKTLIKEAFEFVISTEVENKSSIEKLYKESLNILENNEPLAVKDLAVTGNDLITILNINPGKEIGIILAKLLDLVLENPSLNTKENLLNFVKENQAIKL